MEKKNSYILSLKEASRFLNCHPNTLRNWDRQGILKPIRMGVRGDRKYKLRDLKNFIKINY